MMGIVSKYLSGQTGYVYEVNIFYPSMSRANLKLSVPDLPNAAPITLTGAMVANFF